MYVCVCARVCVCVIVMPVCVVVCYLFIRVHGFAAHMHVCVYACVYVSMFGPDEV